MQKLIFTNGNGQSIDLTAGNFGITNWQGLSDANLNIQSQQVPFQDGGVFLDALIDQREIEITIAINDNNNLELRYQKKRELISALNPKLGEGVLIYTNDFLSKQIKVIPQIPIFENKNSNDAGTLKASVTFTCCSPYWEDLEETIIELKQGVNQIINNSGDIPAHIKVKVIPENDEVADFQITNNTNQDLIKVNGVVSKEIDIDTNVGNKKVELSSLKEDIKYFSQDFTDAIKVGNIIYAIKGNCVQKSINGLEFQTIYCSGTNITLREISYFEEKNIFVVICSNGFIITSSDGDSWKIQDISQTEIYQIDYSPKLDLFLISSRNGKFITTSDLINFNSYEVSGISERWESIKWISNLELFLAFNLGKCYYSSDGLTWDSANLPSSDYLINDIIIINNTIYVLGINESGCQLFYSADALVWNSGSSIENNNLRKIIKINGFYYLYGNNGVMYRTQYQNLTGWSQITTNFNQDIHVGISFDDMIFFYSKDIIVSIDGLVWKTQIISLASGESLGKICKNPDETIFIILSSNCVLKSKDCIKWVKVLEDSRLSFLGNTHYIQNKFYVSGKGVLFSSEDGESWNEIIVDENDDHVIGNFDYSEKLDLWVAEGYEGYYTSSDLTAWTFHSIGDTISGLCWIPELEFFIMGVGARRVKKSLDGLTWSDPIFISLYRASYIKYIPQIHKIVISSWYNESIEMIESEDGESWSSSNIGRSASDITYNDYEIFMATTNYVSDVFYRYFDSTISYKLKKQFNLFIYNGVIWVNKLNCFVAVGNYGTLAFFMNEKENIINKISEDSNLDFTLEVGNNEIIADSLIGNCKMILSFKQKYIGV